MLASLRVGSSYRQELYAGHAEYTVKITALNVTVTLRNGKVYTNALRRLEWTPLDPGALENKYCVPGLGQVRSSKADGREPKDCVGEALPLKEAKLIVERNSTDRETGFQGFLGSEGRQRLDLTGPGGEDLLSVEGLGEVGSWLRRMLKGMPSKLSPTIC